MALEAEIQQLARSYGDPARATFEFTDLTAAFAEWVTHLTRRRGEIILQVPRGAGRVLLHTKAHYPEGVYRLPTGGIQPNEAVDVAARRECLEELGFVPQTLQLRAIFENIFWVKAQRLVYPSFLFQTEAYTKNPAPTDPAESISGFMDADLDELRAAAHYLSSLPGNWREWGKFRAASHDWLAAHWDV